MEDVEMQQKQQEFAKSLRSEKAQESQNEIAKEAIRRALFKILSSLDIENGKKVELNHVVDLILLELGNNLDREMLEAYIRETIQSGKYKYKINQEEKIISDLNKLAHAQKKHNDRESEVAKEILQTFIQKVEIFAKELSNKKIKITKENLKSQFEERELEDNKIWIDLAVTKYLSIQKQER